MKQLGARLANWMPTASDSGLQSHVRVSHAGASGGHVVCVAVCNAPQCIPEGPCPDGPAMLLGHLHL